MNRLDYLGAVAALRAHNQALERWVERLHLEIAQTFDTLKGVHDESECRDGRRIVSRHGDR